MLTRRQLLKTASLGGLVAGAGLALPRGALASPQPPRRVQPLNPRDPLRLPGGVRRRVLVVGGGLAGLSAALELAERGFEVVVREAAEVLGGKLSTRRVATPVGDFAVEHGLHMWFDNYHVFRDIRARLGIDSAFRPYPEVHFVFRRYQPEVLAVRSPSYPQNVFEITDRSPNLDLLDALSNLNVMSDVMFYRHDYVYDWYDGRTFRDWAQARGVDAKFFDVLLHPAASVTLNDPERISAAEMIHFLHFFFLSQPTAIRREVTTRDHGTAVIDPWVARLRQLGVILETRRPVAGLRFERDRVVGEVGSNEVFDAVVLACAVGGVRRVLGGSRASDPTAARALDRTRDLVAPLRVAPPYKVLRVWLDRRPDPARPDVVETPEHRPINLIAQIHLLEEEAGAWAQRSGGAILELHLYADARWASTPDDRVWGQVRPTLLEVWPELASARVLASTVGSHEDFTSYEVGQGRLRPLSGAPQGAGVQNLTLAGDWVRTTYPSALMERAVATGREAANHVLLRNRVRQVPFTVTTSEGPGLI